MSADVDIVVPVYGSQEHLEKLVPALIETTGLEATVTFSEDATPPEKGGIEVREYLKRITSGRNGWRAVYASKNQGFATTNHVGLEGGSAPYVCSLNSDTVPQPGWLKSMIELMDRMPQVGAAGAKLIFPPWSNDPRRPAGKIQHAGVAFNTQRLPYHLFLGWSPDHPKVNRHLMMKAVTGACIVIRRPLWNKVGGFDPEFGQGNFEDIDTCLKIVEAGYDVAYNPESVLYHWGSGSGNVQDAEKNAMLFLHRWSDKIESDDWMYW